MESRCWGEVEMSIKSDAPAHISRLDSLVTIHPPTLILFYIVFSLLVPPRKFQVWNWFQKLYSWGGTSVNGQFFFTVQIHCQIMINDVL